MGKVVCRYTLMLLAIVLLAGCASLKAPDPRSLQQGQYQPVKDYMSRYIQREMKRSDLVGLSVALVHDQQIVWSEGFGFADKSNQQLTDVNTLFRAGSVSKLFTAIAVMQLVEAGKLQLDAPLHDSVPEFGIHSRFGSIDGITLRNTLSHRAGLPGNIIDGMWETSPASYRTVADRLHRYYTVSPPNHWFAYSNAGYTLAGMAVENASGEAYPQYMQHHVLAPLGMKHSNFELNVSDYKTAKSYWNNKEVLELGLRDLPAGGLVTSVIDLSELIKLVNANGRSNSTRILGADTLAMMLRPQVFDTPYQVQQDFGLGWFSFPGMFDGRMRAVGHGGQTMSHSALVVSVPETKMGVVLLANSPNLTQSLERIAKELLTLAYPVATGRQLPEKINITAPSLPSEETPFTGRYASAVGYLDITGESSPYKIKAMNTTFMLRRQTDGWHKLYYKLLGLIPIAPGELAELEFRASELNGEKLIYVQQNGLQDLMASQVEVQQEYAAWQARLGDYDVTNPIDTDIAFFNFNSASLDYSDGFYALSILQSGTKAKLPLIIIDDQHAVVQGKGQGLGQTLIVTDDGKLDYAGLLFERRVEQ